MWVPASAPPQACSPASSPAPSGDSQASETPSSCLHPQPRTPPPRPAPPPSWSLQRCRTPSSHRRHSTTLRLPSFRAKLRWQLHPRPPLSPHPPAWPAVTSEVTGTSGHRTQGFRGARPAGGRPYLSEDVLQFLAGPHVRQEQPGGLGGLGGGAAQTGSALWARLRGTCGQAPLPPTLTCGSWRHGGPTPGSTGEELRSASGCHSTPRPCPLELPPGSPRGPPFGSPPRPLSWEESPASVAQGWSIGL